LAAFLAAMSAFFQLQKLLFQVYEWLCLTDHVPPLSESGWLNQNILLLFPGLLFVLLRILLLGYKQINIYDPSLSKLFIRDCFLKKQG